MDTSTTILVIGHGDLMDVGLCRGLEERGFRRVVSISREGIDPTRQDAVDRLFARVKPACVCLGSLRSGGIEANRRQPGAFAYHNLLGTVLAVEAARRNGIERLIFFGSSCMYPRNCPQPMTEEAFLSGGPLEPTSEAYALAKAAGVLLCRGYRRQYGLRAITAVPATLYGPGVLPDPEEAHVLEALMARFTAAASRGDPEIVLWGSGTPRREFLYIEDFVDAVCFLLAYDGGEEFVNIGSGEEVTIVDLARMIAAVTGYRGRIRFDPERPDGAPRKCLDVRRLAALGWRARVTLEEGLRRTWAWYHEALGKDPTGKGRL